MLNPNIIEVRKWQVNQAAGRYIRSHEAVQHISIRGKGVAAVRHSLNGDSVTAQSSHSLPHRCAADAQLRGQLLPGDIPSACRVQRRQHLLLDHIHAPL